VEMLLAVVLLCSIVLAISEIQNVSLYVVRQYKIDWPSFALQLQSVYIRDGIIG
jgi:hypothetical protein